MQLVGDLVDKDAFILLVDNRKEKRLLKISDNKKFKWRKIQIDLQQLLLHPYFSTFQVENGVLTKIEKTEEDQQDDDDGQFPANDNRDIFTTETTQKLEHEQIEELKKTKDPQALIDMIAQNNQQFQQRTQYSKEKYLKRKKAKYIFIFTVYKTTIQNISDYYYHEDGKVISNLRWDAFALFLHLTSISPSMLVFEKTKGLLPSALVIRGAGSVTVVAEDSKSNSKIVNQQLNLTKQQNSKIKYTPFKQVQQGTCMYNNLAILGDFDSKPIIASLKGHLVNNAIVTLYSLYLEPLSQAFNQMMSSKEFLNIQMFDTFTRQYQVLKNRTHPMMSMDGFGGYILCAIKVRSE